MGVHHRESDEQLNEEHGGGAGPVGGLQNKLVIPCKSNGSQTDRIIKQVYVKVSHLRVKASLCG